MSDVAVGCILTGNCSLSGIGLENEVGTHGKLDKGLIGDKFEPGNDILQGKNNSFCGFGIRAGIGTLFNVGKEDKIGCWIDGI